MRRSLVVIALTASLAQPAFFEPLWIYLASVWSGSSADAGCGMDPDGGCAPEQPDAGCGADPNGMCTPDTQEATDAGCGWDPFGCPKGS